MLLDRRDLLRSLVIGAPAIVASNNLMKVRGIIQEFILVPSFTKVEAFLCPAGIGLLTVQLSPGNLVLFRFL